VLIIPSCELMKAILSTDKKLVKNTKN
jgi:hypothetical protein